jgi:hypothetical protein
LLDEKGRAVMTTTLALADQLSLRRVALGLADSDRLPKQELERLTELGLIRDVDGKPELTALGRRCYDALPGATYLPDLGERRLSLAVAAVAAMLGLEFGGALLVEAVELAIAPALAARTVAGASA